MLRSLDLFSGACGGWSLGFERAGIETVAACEIDEWRRRQYARHFPNVRLYDDVRLLTGERLKADVGHVDIVCGSPPCQDASAANTKGRGVDGERTGLYLEAIRIVGEARPSWIAFENVPGIRNRGIDRILRLLEEIDYTAWPLVVGALDIGAPHIRKRSWVIGCDSATVLRLAEPWDQPNGDRVRFAPFSEIQQMGTGQLQPRERLPLAPDAGRTDTRGGSEDRGRGSCARDVGEVPSDAEEREGRSRSDESLSQPHGGARGDDQAPPDEPRNGRRSRRSGRSSPGDAGISRRQHPQAEDSSDSESGGAQEREDRAEREAGGESQERSDVDATGEGLEVERSEPDDDDEKQSPLERAITARLGSIAETWNGGITGRLRMDDGIPRGMARPLLAAYGDTILPQISEIIGAGIVTATEAIS